MAEDSTRPPDAAAQAKTRAFLGSESQRLKARIVVVRGTTYGLGELAMTVHGDGRVSARHQEFSSREKVHEAGMRIASDEAQRLFSAFVEEAFTEMVIASHCGVPDEIHFTIQLTNAEERSHKLGKFVQTEHDRFDRLVRLVQKCVAAHLDAKAREQLTV